MKQIHTQAIVIKILRVNVNWIRIFSQTFFLKFNFKF